jgi:hypothetical protein
VLRIRASVCRLSHIRLFSSLLNHLYCKQAPRVHKIKKKPLGQRG